MTVQNITILHADDDESATELFREYTRHHYCDIAVRSVLSGSDALTRLETTDDVDCVVSDYEMPSLNGLELLEAVRKRWPDLPFILFTGRGDENTAMRAINAGVTDYLQKRVGTSQYAVLVNRIRNVVAKHQAEVQLKQTAKRSQAQLELLVNTVEDYAIFILDKEGYIRTWNGGAENIKGYSSDEIIGKHFSVFYRDEDVSAGLPDQNLRKAAAEGRVVDEGWRVRKDGSEFWADVRITALHEDGELIGYAKVTRDSTQHHREQVLLQQKEQLQDLMAAVSHDLKTPLYVIGGNIELARESGDFSRLDAAERGLNRATELVDYLEVLATEGKWLMKPKSVELAEVAEAAWSVVGTEGEADFDLSGDIMFMADRERLRQLLENLFKNAVEHAGPDVTVSVGPLNQRTGFYAEDDGPGIPESLRNKVFEMGYSGDPEGTGFGLAICQQIAEAHGWFIEVTEGSDGGARFEVSDVEVS